METETDDEFLALAKEELAPLEKEKEEMEADLKVCLLYTSRCV